jgi:hypothetical protein
MPSTARHQVGQSVHIPTWLASLAGLPLQGRQKSPPRFVPACNEEFL